MHIIKRKIKTLYLMMQNATWKETMALRSLYDMFSESSDFDLTIVDARGPLIPTIKKREFDLIVLSPTFLCARYQSELLSYVKKKFDFVQTSKALKVAFPQDDYDCSRILDQWMCDWNVDLIYSVCPENWELLYPSCLSTSKIRLGFTKYLTNSEVNGERQSASWWERKIDVSYRGSYLTTNFGQLGQIKSRLPQIFLNLVDDPDQYRFDFHVGSGKMIRGKAWFKFLESSRFVLVSPSGSSLIDPMGDLRRLVQDPEFRHSSVEHLLKEAARRKLRWHEVENSPISPRNIEAVLSGSVQIAVSGTYSGIFHANDHYIPIASDLDVVKTLRDEFNWLKIQKAAKEALLSVPEIRAENMINEIYQWFPRSSMSHGRISRSTSIVEQVASVALSRAFRYASAVFVTLRNRFQKITDRK